MPSGLAQSLLHCYRYSRSVLERPRGPGHRDGVALDPTAAAAATRGWQNCCDQQEDRQRPEFATLLVEAPCEYTAEQSERKP